MESIYIYLVDIVKVTQFSVPFSAKVTLNNPVCSPVVRPFVRPSVRLSLCLFIYLA